MTDFQALARHFRMEMEHRLLYMAPGGVMTPLPEDFKGDLGVPFIIPALDGDELPDHIERLPFDRCWFVSMRDDLQRFVSIVCAEQLDDGIGFVVVQYCKQTVDDDASPVVMAKIKIVFDGDGELFCNDDRFYEPCCDAIRDVLIALVQMASVPETVERHDPSEQAQRSRRKHGKPPLPAVRVLRLDPSRRVYERDEQDETDATGQKRKSPIPHDRRGTWRHYKTGKVTWVRASRVGAGDHGPKGDRPYVVEG